MSKNQTGFKLSQLTFGFWRLLLHSNSKRSFFAYQIPACLLSPLLAVLSPSPMGVTGFEPVTLRLSSACSNQLSYTPEAGS